MSRASDYEHCKQVTSSGARGFVSKTKLLDTDFGQF